jgi:hypothetical protein
MNENNQKSDYPVRVTKAEIQRLNELRETQKNVSQDKKLKLLIETIEGYAEDFDIFNFITEILTETMDKEAYPLGMTIKIYFDFKKGENLRTLIEKLNKNRLTNE